MARLFLLPLVLLLSSLATLQAQKVPQRDMKVAWASRAPHISFRVHDFADASLVAKLKSGLPQTLVTRIYAYSTGGGRPLAIDLRSCRVVFDLWEEVYRVQLQTRTRDETRRTSNAKDVQNWCLGFGKIRVGNAADYDKLRGGSIYFSVIVELNPLSTETVERIRRWLTRPGGAGRLEGDAFFGSFVSIFVTRRIGAAERTMTFRSTAKVVP